MNVILLSLSNAQNKALNKNFLNDKHHIKVGDAPITPSVRPKIKGCKLRVTLSSYLLYDYIIITLLNQNYKRKQTSAVPGLKAMLLERKYSRFRHEYTLIGTILLTSLISG